MRPVWKDEWHQGQLVSRTEPLGYRATSQSTLPCTCTGGTAGVDRPFPHTRRNNMDRVKEKKKGSEERRTTRAPETSSAGFPDRTVIGDLSDHDSDTLVGTQGTTVSISAGMQSIGLQRDKKKLSGAQQRKLSRQKKMAAGRTDGSKTEQGTGAGIYSGVVNTKLSIPLGTYTSVFQAEAYALLQCAVENNVRAYRNRRIYIMTDSQAVLKGLQNHKFTSRLLWECWKEPSDLARHIRVVLLWVPGHSGISGNEKADELARTVFIGPEPAVGVSKTMVRGQVKEWVNAQHKEYWNNITRHQHGKTFIREPSKKLTLELLALSRNKLRIITGLLTGHCALKSHLARMGLYNGDLNCRLCGKGVESAYHILCQCEALDRRRQAIYGRLTMTPAEYSTHPAAWLYCLVQGSRVLEWVL